MEKAIIKAPDFEAFRAANSHDNAETHDFRKRMIVFKSVSCVSMQVSGEARVEFSGDTEAVQVGYEGSATGDGEIIQVW